MATYESRVPQPSDRALDVGLPAWEGPSSILQAALAATQADMDAAGLSAPRLSFEVTGGFRERPVVSISWKGAGSTGEIDVEEADLTRAVIDVAGRLGMSLVDLDGIYWPVCPTHRRRASARADNRDHPVWWCTARGSTPHTLAVIGALSGSWPAAGPLWCRLHELRRP